MAWTQHLVIAPILLPMATGAFLLLFDERRNAFKSFVNVLATLLLLALSIVLLRIADISSLPGGLTLSYAVGGWPAPFGIVLVLDRLSALMLVLSAVPAVAAVIYSLARWHNAGSHFHTLFQFLLMGINGAFLTGDLFNLFVFFEVMLAASYGLLLHGLDVVRVRAGLHYIAVNLVASLFFLIGVSLIYGVIGTLNMADLAVRLTEVSPENRTIFEAGAGILGIAFLIKVGMWPLCFWLPPTYTAAAAPVGAMFALLSKVGLYLILRLSMLLFGGETGALAGFGGQFLFFGGLATIAFGTIGILASQSVGRLASYNLLVSSGTLLAATGIGDVSIISAALFYLVSSTLTLSAMFLLIELVERAQEPGANLLTVTMEAYGDEVDDDGEEEQEVGLVMPGALAIIGICFGCVTLLLAGLPPLSGFIAKFALLAAMFNLEGLGGEASISGTVWIFATLSILSGLAALISLLRTGIRTFWAPLEAVMPRVLVVEAAPIVLLIGACLMLTFQGAPLLRYTDATSQALHAPANYVDRVLPPPADDRTREDEQ